MSSLIYVVEDDDNIREILRCTLESYGHETVVFDCAPPVLEQLQSRLPDLILMDIMMPGMDGSEALRQIKQNPRTKDVPVIFLTAKSGEIDKVKGLDLGADDYITKPFGLLELAARVRTALRRSAGQSPQQLIKSGEITIDVDNHEVFCGERQVELTLKEFELLKILVLNSSRVMPRDELLGEIWGFDYIGETRTLDMHIKTLRAKLGDDVENPKYIKTVRSVGYRFIG